MYEVKTRDSVDRILHDDFSRNKFYGGSFNAYCKLKNSLEQDQKMFLVVLPRNFIRNRKGEDTHPVFIAEIEHVVPRIVGSIFNPALSTSDFHFASTISVRLPKRKWFDLPNPEKINYVEIMKRLFIEQFSLGEYQRLDAEYFEDESDNEDDNELDVANGMEEETDVEELKSAVENLKVGDADNDDWDSMYD